MHAFNGRILTLDVQAAIEDDSQTGVLDDLGFG